MRAYFPQILLATSLCLACTEDKDPLETQSGTESGDPSGDPSGSTSSDSTTSTTASTDSTTTTSSTSAATDSTTTTTSTSNSTDTTTTASTDSTTTTSTTTGNPQDPWEAARQLCVDTINMYRATLGLPPYERWFDAETCSDGEAQSDGQTGVPHGAFGMCDEFAQNECPGWPAPAEQSLPGCLAQMWAEGPGDDFNTHGHYINMSSESYTRVACGFAEGQGGLWMVQNFQ